MAEVKLFVSQPMNGLTNEEIEREREKCIEGATAFLKKNKFLKEETDVVAVDSFFKDAPHYANPLWYLGESIKKMAEADFVVFARGWRNARGCVVENAAAGKYGTQMVGVYAELYGADSLIYVMDQAKGTVVKVNAND